ncbi:acetyltransferase protein [Colletotrichum truncatum]|uniref:Acetyltransferase protein n=1 Tax=Colletotrichum truncatum TaxID=5467 RepID=A0ACC3YL50_COLTU
MQTDPVLEIKDLSISRATHTDIPVIQAIVNRAYAKYIDRIGRPPAPMTANYTELLTAHNVFVLKLTSTNDIVGSIILSQDAGANSIKINNLVVDTVAQGRGYGGLLMRYAEAFAEAKGRTSLTLFTNVKMYENVALYQKMGFVETERKTENGYERVYFRKDL